MTTVPNWIAKGYAYRPAYGAGAPDLHRITSWRATKTQVVVELEGVRTEMRFRLDDLKKVGQRNSWNPDMILIAPDDPRVTKALSEKRRRSAASDLKGVIASTRIDGGSMSAEELIAAFDAIRTAATEAMAALTGEL